jgi:hypothetical protein
MPDSLISNHTAYVASLRGCPSCPDRLSVLAGMRNLLSVNPKVKIYAPKDGLGGIFGSDVTSKFYRKDEALPAEKRVHGGRVPRRHFQSFSPT